MRNPWTVERLTRFIVPTGEDVGAGGDARRRLRWPEQTRAPLCPGVAPGVGRVLPMCPGR